MTEESITPAFDWIDGVWYTDDGVTARSLAALQRKFPGRKIEGYYPDGYGNVIRPRVNEDTKAAIARELAQPIKPLGTITEAGLTADEPRPPNELVKPKPSMKRQVGRYQPAPGFQPVQWTAENKEKLKIMVERGLRSKEIASEFGCSGNAIIGACNRYGYHLKYFDK